MRVAINGFGRIGKLVFRAFLERNLKNIDIVAINELGSLESSHHLLKYDSIHGNLPLKITNTNKELKYNNKKTTFYSESGFTYTPWLSLDILKKLLEKEEHYWIDARDVNWDLVCRSDDRLGMELPLRCHFINNTLFYRARSHLEKEEPRRIQWRCCN